MREVYALARKHTKRRSAHPSGRVLKAIVEPDEQHQVELLRLYRLPYWSRHWIAQELALGRHRNLLYGRFWLPCANFAISLDHDIKVTDTSGQSLQAKLLDVERLRGLRMVMQLSRRNSLRKDVWPTAMPYCSQSEREDMRDKVFGIQSVFPPELQTTVDFRLPIREVYHEAAWPYVQNLSGWDMQL